MYRHLKVTSLGQMNNEIIRFMTNLLTDSASSIDGDSDESTQQDVIKKFLASLNDTTKYGMGALDDAVSFASGGIFANMQELIDRFLSDLEDNSGSYVSKKKNFLRVYCGIDLDNADTGSISGADAGGDTIKTAESIVPENSVGPISSWSMPTLGSSSTFNGLTINWPSTLVDISDSGGSGVIATVASQQQVLKALNSEWMADCLKLVVDSLDMSFEDSGATVRTIDLKFTNDSDASTLASVISTASGSSPYDTETDSLTLEINMYFYNNLDDTNVSGSDLVSGQTELDRVLAHEFVHAVMSANIRNYVKLPNYIIEGMADLVIGADDGRKPNILKLSNPACISEFRKMLEGEVDDIDDVTRTSAYAGGFMLLRYLARQSVPDDDEDDVDDIDIIKIKSKNGNQVMWFVKDPSRGGFAVWIGDVKLRKRGLDNPWEDDSTVGVAGKYKLDMWRKEIDAGETASAKAKVREQNQKGYDLLMQEADNATEMRNAKIIWYVNNEKINDDIEVYEDVCHRMETTNACHLGGLLKWDEVPSSTFGFKWLDCLYKDNSFMFSLYQPELPYITRNLIIGEIEPYHDDTSGRTFFMSNSWILKSYVKQGSYNDSFFLEDIVGEDRIPQQQQVIAMGENDFMGSYINNYEDKKVDETDKKAEMDSKKAIWDDKRHLAQQKREEYNVAKQRSDTARADADQETDPDAKADKEQWAEELEATTQRLDDEANRLEADEQQAEQEYIVARNNYTDAQEATQQAFNQAKSAYVDVFSKDLLNIPTRDESLHHHVSDCPATDEVITYNNDIFCAYRLDVDADATGDADYSVNGHKTAFHLHTAPKDLHLRYYDVSARYYPPETLTSPLVVGWEHQILHYTYESYESNVGANIYPLLDTVKKEYEIYDTLAHRYKPFQCFSRSGTGGNSVNNVNNISTVIPLTMYVERDDEAGDTWSAVGQTDIVNYVNMYNMGTGTMFHPQQHHAGNLFGCYNLWRRRMEITPWNPVINDIYDEWTEVWGFGGYVGIAFKTKLKDDLTELRRRVVV